MYYHKIMSLRPMHVYKININSVAKFTSSRMQDGETIWRKTSKLSTSSKCSLFPERKQQPLK